MKIGDTLYHFDINRRVYTKPPKGSGRVWGDLIYSEHFRPMKIIGENKRSWLLQHGYKADKKAPRKHGFFTAAQMADDIWVKDHRHKIARLLDQATADHLREIARILGYSGHRKDER